MTHYRGDLIAAAVLAAFGVYIIWVASGMPYVSEVGPGHGFFPLWLGIGLVSFASALMLSPFISAVPDSKSTAQSRQSLIRPLGGWLAVMAAIALLGRIGFVLSFVILTLFLVVVLDRRPILLAMAVAVGLAVAFHVIFVIALDVSLPKPAWGF
jgi:putative tricarboxylic transport membrane protein